MVEPMKDTAQSVRQLLVIALLLLVAYGCTRTLQCSIQNLNQIGRYVFYAIPFFAIWPVFRLRRPYRAWGIIVLTPVLLWSFFCIVLGGGEHREVLQTLQQRNSTIELQRYDYGGAVGVHGINLEQRRRILPGLYLVKSVYFFDFAKSGTLSVEGPETVRVRAKGNYGDDQYQIDKTYHLQPWVFF